MSARIRIFFLIAALATSVTVATYGQRVGFTISGIVYDSLLLTPMQYVTVINQTANQGTTTDEQGKFTLAASAGDSLLFTILGYSRKVRWVRPDERVMVIFLREFALTLQTVTIYGNYKPQGSDRWKSVIELPQTFRNPAGPGSGYAIETFGPGVSLGGLITRMTKSEKEKRKVKTVREKARQSETYLSLIVSDETKGYFQRTFSMTESDYEKFIESFNQSHPEAVYLQSKEEILNLMVIFIATKK